MFRRRAPERKSWSPAALPGTACGYWRALSHRVTRESDAAKYAKARREKTERILVVDIGEVVDPAEHLELIVDRIVSAKVDRRVARRGRWNESIAVGVDPATDMEHSSGQGERIDRTVDRRDPELLFRTTSQFQTGTRIYCACERVIRTQLDAVDDVGGDEALGAFSDRIVNVDQRRARAVGIYQVSNVVLEVGRTEAKPIVEQRLLEAYINSPALLRLKVWV